MSSSENHSGSQEQQAGANPDVALRVKYTGKMIELEFSDKLLLQSLGEAREYVRSALVRIGTDLGSYTMMSVIDRGAGEVEETVALPVVLLVAEMSERILKACQATWKEGDPDRDRMMRRGFPSFSQIGKEIESADPTRRVSSRKLSHFVPAAMVMTREIFPHDRDDLPSNLDALGLSNETTKIEVPIMAVDLPERIASIAVRRLVSLIENINLSPETQERPVIPEHSPLLVDIQEIVSTNVIRMAGYNERGRFLGQEKLLKDLETVLTIEKDLVIDPADVKTQLQRLKEARAETMGKPLNPPELQQISKFAALGGHANLNTIDALLEMLKHHGYVCLLEYTIDGVVVPCGYIYGFSESFAGGRQSDREVWQERFPTLSIRSIAAPDVKVNALLKKKKQIMTNWRTSTPSSFQSLASAGIAVPVRLLHPDESPELQSPRMWGGGSALKRVIAGMGRKLHKEMLTLNVGTIEAVDELLGVDIPNIASDKYNSEFVDRSAFSRNKLDQVKLPSDVGAPQHVANIRWQIYSNMITSAIKRLDRDQGTLKAKGGWDIPRLDRFGHTLANIDRNQLRRIANKLQKEIKSKKRGK